MTKIYNAKIFILIQTGFLYNFFLKKKKDRIFISLFYNFFFFSGSHALGNAGLPQFGSWIVRLF
jgi:hypothetical protein